MARIGTNTTTHFFREPRGLALACAVLGPRPTVWCAGCSTGDEPYSLVIAALEAGVTIDVIASDVNPVALRAAEVGIYAARNLRHVDAARRERWFETLSGGRYRVRDEVRARVRFMLHDLTWEPAPGRGLDAVFCRNVMVYFRRDQATRAVATMTSALRPDGVLVIGASEWLPGEVRAGSPELQLEEQDGVMLHRRGARSFAAGGGFAVRAAVPVVPRVVVEADAPPTEPDFVLVPHGAAAPVPDDFVDHLRRAGDSLLDAGSAAEARVRYREALVRGPLMPDLHLRIALTHLHDVSEPREVALPAAREVLRKCLFLAPDLWPAWILLAEATAPVDPRAALSALERARSLLAAPAPAAAPEALAGFVGDARAARDAVRRWMVALRGRTAP